MIDRLTMISGWRKIPIGHAKLSGFSPAFRIDICKRANLLDALTPLRTTSALQCKAMDGIYCPKIVKIVENRWWMRLSQDKEFWSSAQMMHYRVCLKHFG